METLAAPPPTLGPEDVALLLRVLGTHARLLDPSQLDAKRVQSLGQDSCYLLDYQEVHAYIFERDDSEGAFGLMEELFSFDDLQFVIGPGTLIEIAEKISEITGIDMDLLQRDRQSRSDEEMMNKYLPRIQGFLKSYANEEMQPPREPFARLLALLRRPNVALHDEFVSSLADFSLDRDVLRTVGETLGGSRDRPMSNFADALNYAWVTALQRIASSGRFPFFPFLLTHTPTLLKDERFAKDALALKWGFEPRVLRTPLAALYSHVAAETVQSPRVVGHLRDLAAKIAAAQRDLRDSPSYEVEDSSTGTSSIWVEFIDGSSISQEAREQFETLAEVVEDPVVSEAQAVLDRIRLSVNNRLSLQGGGPPEDDEPRRLFDVIISIYEILQRHGALSEALRDGYSDLLQKDVLEHETLKRSCFSDKASRLLINIEYYSTDVETYFSFTWPTSKRIAQLVEIANGCYARHAVDDIHVFVGTDEDEIVKLVGTLPVSFDAIRGLSPRRPRWVRFESGTFDLYFDVYTSPRDHASVGVIISDPNREHIEELYAQTSSRFLFPSWLDRALAEAGVGDGS